MTPRANPIFWLAHDSSTASIEKLVRCLDNTLPENLYDPFTSNCQHFTKLMFDKLADDKSWGLKTPADITSPLILFSNSGYPFYGTLFCVSFIFEICLLLDNDNRNGASFYYQCMVCTLILVSFLILLHFIDEIDEDTFELIGAVIVLLLPSLLIVEAIFCTPFGAISKRSLQYGCMWRSGSTFYKLWLPLCFGLLYTKIMFAMVLHLPLNILRNYLPTYITSALFPSQDYSFRLKNVFTWYVATLVYFYLQEQHYL